MIRKSTAILCVFLLITSSCRTVNIAARVSPSEGQRTAKNIILMIVDGMGFEHVKAARIYNGQKPFSYEDFTCKTTVSTCSYEGADSHGHCVAASDDVTDSAAAATAMATGIKVKNGTISRELPKGHRDVETILEQLQRQGKSTGVIATKLFTDATPAAFMSHADDRDLTEEILKDIFLESTPNLILGADTLLHRQIAKESKKAYRMVHTAMDLKDLANEIANGKSCSGGVCPHIYGGFGQYDLIPETFDQKSGLPLEITPATKFTDLGVPHLSEMTDAALTILSKNDQGFFLMVESSMPDVISHYNRQIDSNEKSPKAISVLIREMLEVENTVKVIESFVAKNPDTLVIVTADHETGGLVIEEDKTACLGQEYCVPTVRWTSKKYEEKADSLARHTAADVPLYAIGRGAERFCAERINNIDIPKLALGR